jgi:PAS domain S-box-containing protein
LLTVLDTIGALIFTKDRRGIYTYANQRFAEVVGLAPPDVPGRRTAELFDPDTARELDETDRQVLASGQTVEQREYRVTRGGAEQRCFLTVKTPVFDPQGGIVGLTGVSMDITESEHNEAQLTASRQMLDAALSACDAHIYMKGRTGATCLSVPRWRRCSNARWPRSSAGPTPNCSPRWMPGASVGWTTRSTAAANDMPAKSCFPMRKGAFVITGRSSSCSAWAIRRA